VVITMSVMPPFTYPNMSLHDHGVITVLHDLQVFPCSLNEGTMCVPRSASLELRPMVVFRPPLSALSRPLH
jgi:hypothetical protein